METLTEDLQKAWNEIFAPNQPPANEKIAVEPSGHFVFTEQVLEVNKYDCTIFDLPTKRFTLYHSNHHHLLGRKSVDTSSLYNSNEVNELTHSDDLKYTLKAEVEAYTELMALPADKQSCFVAMFFRRLKNKQGGYEMFMQRVSVIMDSESTKPEMLSIRTKHIPHMEMDMYMNLRKKGYYKTCKGNGKITNTLQKELRLTQREMEIIRLCGAGVKQSSMADMLHTSKKTIRSHSNNIRRKLGVSTLYNAWKLADRMGLFD